MDNFIVSARKYRPSSFDMVVGQDSITNTLKSAIRNNHLAQSYLFCGPRGVGKTTCARIFAKTINCINLTEETEACNECESCISFNTLRSFNIHELDAASNNKVEDIRSLNEQVRIPPQIGKYSIYIIDEVHMLSSSAFNAFLKTLEEPPSHAIFILATTEKHKIIPTILSRCQIFDFNRIRIEDIVSRLVYVAEQEGITVEEEALHIIGQKADGALRDALSIFDQIVSLSGKSVTFKDVIENLNVLDYEYYFRVIDGALAGDYSSLLITFNEILEKGFDGHNFIAALLSHLRDLLVSKDKVTVRLLEATPAIRKRYIEQSGRCSVPFLYRALDIINNCDLTYKSSKNPRLNAELALLRLSQLTDIKQEEPEKKKSFPEPILKEDKKKSKQSSVADYQGETDGKDVKGNDEGVKKEKHSRKSEHTVEKPSRTISIKDLISENNGKVEEVDKPEEGDHSRKNDEEKSDFNSKSFENAWLEFVDQMKGEGTRITSMFKSLKPELENEKTIKIHLSNATQKDVFVQDYKQKLINFLEGRFILDELDVVTTIDLVEKNGKLYSDEERYNFLFKKYPVLKEMKKTFNLDIQ